MPKDPIYTDRDKEVIGPYRVVKKLRADSLGSTWLVRNEGGFCALKTFRYDLSRDPGAARRKFAEKAGTVKDVSGQPGMIEVMDVPIIDDDPYLLVEFIASDFYGRTTLHDHIRGRRLSPERVRELSLEICSVMIRARESGIGDHGNLIPSAVFICPDGAVKISGFGERAFLNAFGPGRTVTRRRKNLPALSGDFDTYYTYGTPSHMPPEAFENGIDNDLALDIYSFGVLLHQMLSGGALPPAKAGDLHWRAHRHLEPFKSFHLSGGYRVSKRNGDPYHPILSRCLAHNRGDRYSAFGEISADIEALSFNGRKRGFVSFSLNEAMRKMLNGALTYHLLSETEKALSVIDEKLSHNGDVPWLWLYRGKILLDSGEFDRAINSLEKAEFPEGCNDCALAGISLALEGSGEKDAAVSLLKDMVERDKNSPDAWLMIGRFYRRNDNRREALRYLREGLIIDPENREILSEMGQCHLDDNRLQDALHIYERILELDPDDPGTLLKMGGIALSMGAHERAHRLLTRSISGEDCGYEAYKKRGICLLAMGRTEDALADLERAGDLYTGDADTWFNLGECYYYANRHEDALAAFRRALEISPSYTDAWYKKGLLEERAREYDRAIESYRRVLEHDERDSYAWNKTGECLYAQGKYDEAVVCFDRVLKLDPCDIHALNNRGAALFSRGDNENALKCYDAALAIDPGYDPALINRGICLHGEGKFREALEPITKALKVNPKNPDAWLLKATLEEQLDTRWDAVQSYRMYIAVLPDDKSDSIAYAEEKIRILENRKRFTGGALAAMRLAEAEARSASHRFVRPPHLLMGILNMEQSVIDGKGSVSDPHAKREMMDESWAVDMIFNEFDLDRDALRERLGRETGSGRYPHSSGAIHRGSDVKNILTGADALSSAVDSISALDLLASLLHEPCPETVRVLNAFGTDPKKLFKRTRRLSEKISLPGRGNGMAEKIMLIADCNRIGNGIRLDYTLIQGGNPLPFKRTISIEALDELGREINLITGKINGRVERGDYIGLELGELEKLIVNLLFGTDLRLELEKLPWGDIDLHLNDGLLGIPWETAIRGIHGGAMAIVRHIIIDPAASRERPPAAEGDLLLLRGCGEGLPGFEETWGGIRFLLGREKLPFGYRMMDAASESRLSLHLARNTYGMIIYFGHAVFGGDTDNTGWKCMDGSVFSCAALERLRGSVPRVIISSSCESARSSLLSPASFPLSALRSGCGAYVGTQYNLEFEKSRDFLRALIMGMGRPGAGLRSIYANAIKELRHHHGVRDAAAINYVYYEV